MDFSRSKKYAALYALKYTRGEKNDINYRDHMLVQKSQVRNDMYFRAESNKTSSGKEKTKKLVTFRH